MSHHKHCSERPVINLISPMPDEYFSCCRICWLSNALVDELDLVMTSSVTRL